MAATSEYECARCKCTFTARVADRKRGWARFCSKSCKAIKQVQKGGEYTNYNRSKEDNWHEQAMFDMEAGWDGHKNVF